MDSLLLRSIIRIIVINNANLFLLLIWATIHLITKLIFFHPLKNLSSKTVAILNSDLIIDQHITYFIINNMIAINLYVRYNALEN
jgi:hypothetical protein